MQFSVITINFNNGEGLRHTIDSVISQTCHDYEYIIIDGGSTDDSVNVIKLFSDKIDYWVSEKDRGIYHAMNKGVNLAHGQYCIFMNSGDCFYDSSVLEQFKNIGMEEDIIIGKLLSSELYEDLFQPPKRDISMYYLYSATVPHQSSFIKTELLRLYRYDETLKIVSDWKFFVQAIVFHNCSVRYVDDYVATFDLEGISTSNPEIMWKEKEQVLSSFFPTRVLEDYKRMKASECMTQTLTPQLRQHFRIDKFLYNIGKRILNIIDR